jgi:Helix-turn-helix domain
MSLVWENFTRGGSEKLAMLALADWCNDEGGNLSPSMSQISKKINVSEKQARRIIHKLIDEGYLSVVANHAGGHHQQTRHYVLNVQKLLTDPAQGSPTPPIHGSMPLPPMGDDAFQPREPMHSVSAIYPAENEIDTNGLMAANEASVNELQTENEKSCTGLTVEKPQPNCPHAEIIELYKKNLPSSIHPRTWNGARMTTLKARWRESPERQNLDWWDKFFNYISQSNFLMGRTSSYGRDPFEIRLDWIMKKSNFDKIIDGLYENRQRTA